MSDDKNQQRAQEWAKQQVAENWENRYERPRGFLTDTDRRFLWGLKEYAHEQTVSDRRNKVQRRFAQGILDFEYVPRLRDRDRERVFDKVAETEQSSLETAVSNLIELLYLGLDKDVAALEEMVERGIESAENETGEYGAYTGDAKQVDADIDIEYAPDAEAIYEKLQNGLGQDLTNEEIGVLVRSNLLDDDEELAKLTGEHPEVFDPAADD